MSEQEILDLLLKVERASELTQHGIEQFNKGDFENALASFENAFEANPKSVPNLLYYSLCCWSLIRNLDVADRIDSTNPELRKYLEDVKSKLKIAIDYIETVLTFPSA